MLTLETEFKPIFVAAIEALPEKTDTVHSEITFIANGLDSYKLTEDKYLDECKKYKSLL